MAAGQGHSSAKKVQKSPDAFRTISEVSAELDVPQHVLRFWETKFKIVKPLKRGGGRRYYRPADVELIRGIRDLLYKHGYTIKGAQKLLKEQGGKMTSGGNVDAMVSAARQDSNPALARAAETISDSGGGLPDESREKLRSLLGDLQDMKKMLG
ncbi:MerR family transcriptional regulator [Sneathiella marina]|uniref:MerR family transcriptional regulator n=1 Tax=Sneathiella marina TaxID=2950108 RepID=A0ABY4VYY0_9PROT|nr:MerR family transcriptional regulator [Sneathiella marina]USG60060.1 MerR family transcriptional regulator [Sneathiella marina]